MTNKPIDNKKVAKNTLFLYFRMLLLMVISLYTSRVILDKLGVQDYGIYNVVGGIVAMLGFLKTAMNNAVQRFLSFEIGRNNKDRINLVFNVSLQAHVALAFFVLTILEIVGTWYVNNRLVLPADRLVAANWTFQFSVITTFVTIICVPYNACIIAYERMSIYAYVSIVEAILKLLVCYILVIVSIDRLITYSFLIALVHILVLLVYFLYCKIKIESSKLRFVRETKTLKEIFSFAGWNFLGEFGWVLTGQGVDIVLNSFFGPILNAARGIANQVNAAVSNFVGNFQTALNPQIIKSYAAGEYDEMKKLLMRGTRFSYYVMFAISLPIILCMEFILNLWLVEVPEHTVLFCQITLINSLAMTISSLDAQVARASGQMRKYQLTVAAVLVLNFPLSYLVLRMGMVPESTLYVNLFIQLLLIIIRFLLVKNMIDWLTSEYICYVIWPIVKVTLLSLIVPICLYVYSSGTFIWCLIVGFASIISVSLASFYIGMEAKERATIKNMLLKKLKK